MIPDIFHVHAGRVFLSWPSRHTPECRGIHCTCPILTVTLMPKPGSRPSVERPWPARQEKRAEKKVGTETPEATEEEEEEEEEEGEETAAEDDQPWYLWENGRPPWQEAGEDDRWN